MIKEVLKEVNEAKWTGPLSDKSNSSTFNSKKKKMDKDVDSHISSEDSELFTNGNTVYQRAGKKYYSQTFATPEQAWSYLNKIA